LTRKRIGFFGLLGSGNLGNDGSLASVLNHLRSEYPNAVLDAMCGGPDEVRELYDLDATPLHWNQKEYRTAARLPAMARKAFGKVVDAFRIAAWVRRHDVVIVPGMGVLETTLPLRPWGFPYSLSLLSLSGKVFGTKIALVSVGANVIAGGPTRLLVTRAARLAAYRSYRDEQSRTAMRAMGVDTSRDEVYPDLAFALPTPVAPASPGTVGVGVMAYRGGNEDRPRAEEIYRAYVDKLTEFVRWLLENGRTVRLFIGDRADLEVVDELVRLDPARITLAPTATLSDLLREMSSVDTVVATRYHNVLSALKAARPTLSIGYATKNDVLMAEFGLAEFCQSIKELDVAVLRDQFTELESRSPAVIETLTKQNAVLADRLAHQFAALGEVIR
jgi:polysaccharide pyruvyl transferase WcaK-like protein